MGFWFLFVCLFIINKMQLISLLELQYYICLTVIDWLMFIVIYFFH